MKKVERSSHKSKKELLLYLQDLIEENGFIPSEEDDGPSELPSEWTALLNRGGLKFATTGMFHLVREMEIVVRAQISGSTLRSNFKDSATTAIISNGDVRAHWSTLCEDHEWQEEEAEALLKLVVDHWITVRGFSYASAWVEQYKIANKKIVQKMAGKRKQLQGATTTSN